MKKRIFPIIMITAVTGMALVACTEVLEDSTSPYAVNDHIMFHLPEIISEPQTRGVTMAADSLRGGFGVCCSVYPSTSSYADNGCGTYFYKEKVIPNTVTLFPWPTSDYSLSFYAYYPYDSYAFKMLSKALENGCPTYSYTVPTNVRLQTEVMTAQKTDVLGGEQPAVNLSFKRHCTAIKIYLTNNTDSNIFVRSIIIKGVKYSGTLHNGNWSLVNTLNSERINPFTLNADRWVTKKETEDITAGKDIFLLLPQILTGMARLRIVTKENSYECMLTGEWKAGICYHYNAELTADGLKVYTADIIPAEKERTTMIQ